MIKWGLSVQKTHDWAQNSPILDTFGVWVMQKIATFYVEEIKTAYSSRATLNKKSPPLIHYGDPIYNGEWEGAVPLMVLGKKLYRVTQKRYTLNYKDLKFKS